MERPSPGKRQDFRLYPINPFLHLLPRTQTELIGEAERRYGWKQRTAEEHIAKLKGLRLADGSFAIREEQAGHTKRLVPLGRAGLLPSRLIDHAGILML
jgi:hypothetical protein